MELPIDHFRLLGVSPAIDAQSVLRTLQLRLDRPPEDGFTDEALEARAQLLHETADLLSDDKRRQRYEAELTAVSEGEPGVIPALVIPTSREVGGLILLWEAGLGAQAFELASRSLQPPRAPALGSGRESDLALLAGLASRQAAEDDQQERHYERAAEILLKGQQLLQRMGHHPELRQELARERDALLPYRVLQLLSRPSVLERREGLALLDKLMERRQGLDGDADPDFARPAFEAFFAQIRPYLTVQEQIDLFDRWAQEGSRRADRLTAMALAASGFAQRKPQRIAQAAQRLERIDATGLAKPLACLTLLLGQVEEAQALFQGLQTQTTGTAEQPISGEDATTPEQENGPAAAAPAVTPLAELCLTCASWLRVEVLPGYRDVEIDADLEAWFADRDIQDYVDQQDRRLGRRRPAPAIAAPAAVPPVPIAPFVTAGGSLEPTLASDPEASGALDDDLGDGDFDGDDAWEDDDSRGRWRWPALPALRLPTLQLPTLQPPSLPLSGLKTVHWLAIGGGVAVAVAATLWWTLRPKPQALAVQPLAASPQTSSGSPPQASLPPQAPPAVIDAATAPLRAETPTDAQIRQLLNRWLEAKAQVMAGKTAAEPLLELATPQQLDQLNRSRGIDQQAGHHKVIDAKVTDLAITPSGAGSIQVRAAIRYGDRVLDQNGRVVSEDPPTTLHNTYVFGRGADGIWRLTDFRPGS